MKFINFIKDELMTFLRSNYRVDDTNLTLSGHSLGGLLALYTLFSEPQLFSNYIASSPYTYYDLEELLSLEQANQSKIEEANCRVFISFGAKEEEEKYIVPNTIILNQLKQRDSNYINLNFRIFEDGVHFSTPSEAMAYGLLHAFK